MCVKFYTEVLDVRFGRRSMDNIKTDLTETYVKLLVELHNSCEHNSTKYLRSVQGKVLGE